MATERTAMLLRTECRCGLVWPFFSTHVSDPNRYWPSGASVRVILMVNDLD